MSKYDFSYARPYAGTNNPFLRICGAMHDVFKTACDYSGNFAKVTDHRISTGFFFNGKEVIQAMCKSVSSSNAAARVYSRFDEHYDVDCYGEGIEYFLENMPEKDRAALDFMLRCAIDSEVGRERIESAPERIAQFKIYMEHLCDSYDLMDPRLSTAEGLYNAEKVDAPDAQQCDDMAVNLCDSVSALMGQDLTSDVISDANLLRLCDVKSTLNAAQHYIDQYTECLESYMGLSRHGSRVAKTFLYSHVTSNMGEFGTEEFRDRLYDSIAGLSSERSIGKVKDTILSQVKEQLGLSLLSIGKAKNAEKIYDDLKATALCIATDFFDLNHGKTAQSRVLKLRSAKAQITNTVESVQRAVDGVFLQDDKGRFIFNPIIERQRYLRVQGLYICNDLSADDLQLLTKLYADIGLTKWTKDRNPKERIAADLRVVNKFQKCAGAYQAEQGVSAISVSLTTKNLARQFGLAVRPSDKDPAQLIVRDRGAHLEKFLIR